MKLTIPGHWWDSYLYRGKLHLFARDGEARTIDWQRLVEEWPTGRRLRLPMDAAFGDGGYLYGSRWRRMFGDRDVRRVLQRKFDALSRAELTVDRERLDAATIHRTTWPTAFPFSDMTVYANRLFTASPEGLFEYPWDWGDHPDAIPPDFDGDRRWDAPLVAVEAAYGRVALAAGDAGLHELPLERYPLQPLGAPSVSDAPEHLLTTHCSDCHWLYYSVLGSSHLTGGALAAFRREVGEESPREFETVVQAEEIFERSLRSDSDLAAAEAGASSGYVWGSQDKVYWARAGRLLASSYHPGRRNPSDWFDPLGTVGQAQDDVIDAETTIYGIVVETDSDLTVLASDGEVHAIGEEPVNWRAFPRALRYLNQLHVVLEDRLELWAFTHDFFVDQDEKTLGIRYTEREPRRRRPRPR